MKITFTFLAILLSGINTNSQVTQQWVARYNGPFNSYDFAHALVVDLSGNVYVTGESRRNNSYYDITSIKYNSGGSAEWIQRYNVPVMLITMASLLL